MHGEYPRRTTSVVIWLISALIAAFVLEPVSYTHLTLPTIYSV